MCFYFLGGLNDDLFSNNGKQKQIISSAKLISLSSKPTRITPTSATLIDTIITNKSESVLRSGALPCPVADHELTTAIINLRKPKRVSTNKTFRDLKDYSPDVICNFIDYESLTLNQIFTTDNIDL